MKGQLATKFIYIIATFVNVHRFKVQRSGLRKRLKLDLRNAREKCGFYHITAKYHVPDPSASPVMYGTGISQEVGNGGQVCGDVKLSFSRTKGLQNDVW